MLQKYGHGIIGSSACIAGIIPKLLDERQFRRRRGMGQEIRQLLRAEGDFYIELQNQGIRTDAGFTQTELNHDAHATWPRPPDSRPSPPTTSTTSLKRRRRGPGLSCCASAPEARSTRRTACSFENDQFYMKTEEEMREAHRRTSPRPATPRWRWPRSATWCWSASSILPTFPLPEGETEESVLPQARAGGPGKALRQPGTPSASRSAPTTRWASSSSRASRRTSSSCRSTSNGRAARASAWARAAARPPAPSWRTPWASPTWTRCPTACMFERFLSPERVEMPDIDVDFEQGRREEVINHIKDVYGEDHVSQVITFGTLQAKNAVRDAGSRAGLPLQHGRPHLQDDRRRAGHHHRQGAGAPTPTSRRPTRPKRT